MMQIAAGITTLQDGKYRIEKELGRGAFGITYQASLVSCPGKFVVIKTPHRYLMAKDSKYKNYVSVFRKEARSLEKLPIDTHLVQVRDFFEEDKTPYLVMNFVEGETLFQVVKRRGVIPPDEAVGWIAMVAEAIVKVHDCGIVHRDLHPGNIMIKPDGQPVVIDFSIAHEIQPLSKSSVCAGGHEVFAPYEQQTKKDRDPKVDVYALAATLYHIVTGKAPEMPFEIQFARGKLTPPKKHNPAISDRLNRAILSGMAFHPGDRPATMEAWLKILVGDRRVPLFTRRKLLKYGAISAGTGAIAILGNQAVKALRGNAPTPILLSGPPEPTIASLSLTPQDFKSFTLDDRGKPIQATPGSNRYLEEDLGNGIKLRMVLVEGGTFMMGSPPEEALRSEDEGPQHQVKVPNFFMGQFTITQAQWAAIAKLPQVRRPLSPDPAQFKDKDNPIERVSWNEAIEFCDRLTKLTNRPYRLPSEAEWEYACRAGTKTPFHTGPTIITDLANYRGLDDSQGDRGTFLGNYGKGPKGKYRGRTIAANEFPPNAFGLYQMHGNVWEWCLDNWHQGYKDAPSDGLAWLDKNADSSSDRVVRGGSWLISPQNCRSAFRNFYAPDDRNDLLGFRVLFRPAPQASSVSLYTS
jgi:formylglycine-generating enzyme required for sulfatase activity/tRNA A-37 threonylcarbamoyl transferase component Bud32